MPANRDCKAQPVQLVRKVRKATPAQLERLDHRVWLVRKVRLVRKD